MNFDVAGVKAGLLLIPAAFAALSYTAVKLWRGVRRLVRFLDAITGTDDQPGILAVLKLQGDQLTAITKELHPNGGASMRDQIVRVERDVSAVKVMAADAKQEAANAASEAEGLAGALARFHHDARARADVAGRERRGVQETLDVLLASMAEFAQEGHQKERAYVAALQHLGIDLTHVTVELDDQEPGDEP